jgi:uncharacterized protein with HEPN domain
MHADAHKLLWDARSAAERVLRFTSGKSFTEYQQDDLLRSGVERQLEIVGEALTQLRKIDPVTAASLNDLARIVGFRNILIHGYASVDNKIVWGVVEMNIEPLLRSLDKLLTDG